MISFEAGPALAEADSVGGRIELRYIARAGLLPELSRQTYDSLYKALREVVLNSVDAGASRVDIDFSAVHSADELVVADDGAGMTSAEFCEQFMSIGGSTKFGDRTRFGRIGIGSLALLQYGQAAVIETKQRDSDVFLRARIEHPWALDSGQRRGHLGDLPAGHAEEFVYTGSREDHFTRLRLQGVGANVQEVEQDPAALYRLLESLRRVLPLPWTDSPLLLELDQCFPDVAQTLRHHVSQWSIPVYAHSSWERNIELHRRTYGDDPTGGERWTGQLHPILKTLRVTSGSATRQITVAGYILGQRHASTAWSGLTARVQNVAVEEQTFFEVASDPGFRKYISGEVFVLGDLDRERLINIDRSSFNRESPDYRAVQRFMSNQVLHFKTVRVQRPQRQKVEVRRIIERHRASVAAISAVVQHAAQMRNGSDIKGLPSSRNGRIHASSRTDITDTLTSMGVHVMDSPEVPAGGTAFEIDIASSNGAIEARLPQGLRQPTAQAGGVSYRIVFADGAPTDPPVLVRNRPREILFNRVHPSHQGDRAHSRWHMSLALELSYLLTEDDNSTGIYDRMLSFVAVI